MAEISLTEIIKQIEEHSLVIPDFQRGFKWKAMDMRKLLESLLLDYPIGAALFWRTNKSALTYRLIEDIEFQEDVDADDYPDDGPMGSPALPSTPDEIFFILDGQQRITSIYKIFPADMAPQNHEISSRLKGLRFFLDLAKLGMPVALEDLGCKDYSQFSDPEVLAESIIEKNSTDLRKTYREAIGSPVPQRLSESDIVSLCQKNLWLPVTRAFVENRLRTFDRLINNAVARLKDIRDEKAHSATDEEIENVFGEWKDWFTSTYYRTLNSKSFTYIELSNEKPDGLARIFETINSTGMQLSVFDLLVARLGNFDQGGNVTNLRSAIQTSVEEGLLKAFDDPKSLGGTATSQIPRALALRAGVELKKGEILRVAKERFLPHLGSISSRTNSGLCLLRDEMGIFADSQVPFRDLVTLAIACEFDSKSLLFQRLLFAASVIEDWDYGTNEKTRTWYRRINDAMSTPEIAWKIRSELEECFPTFDDVVAGGARKTRPYRTLIAFNLAQGGEDWLGHERLGAEQLEDHHLFPTDWIRNNKSDEPGDDQWRSLSNCVLNRVLVCRKANAEARAQVPPKYLNSMTPASRRKLQIPESFMGPLSTPIQYDHLMEYMRDRYALIRSDMLTQLEQAISD